MKKKILAVLLAAIMVVSLLPVTAMATFTTSFNGLVFNPADEDTSPSADNVSNYVAYIIQKDGSVDTVKSYVVDNTPSIISGKAKGTISSSDISFHSEDKTYRCNTGGTFDIDPDYAYCVIYYQPSGKATHALVIQNDSKCAEDDKLSFDIASDFCNKTDWFSTTPDYAESGTGTADDPYLLSSVEHLDALAKAVNGGNDMYEKFFKLTKDITTPFTGCIGYDDSGTGKQFRGTFDGDYHRVQLNITAGIVSEGTLTAALFGHLGLRGTIKNLITRGSVNVTHTVEKPEDTKTYIARAAGVCANNIGGSIKNCGNTADIQGKNEYGPLMLGGICAANGITQYGGTVTNCYNRGDVFANNSAVLVETKTGYITTQIIGGVCGQNIESGKISNCYSAASVGKTNTYTPLEKENEGRSVGCVCGSNSKVATLSNCYFCNEIGACKTAVGYGDDSSCTGMTENDMKNAAFITKLNDNKNDDSVKWKEDAGSTFNNGYPLLAYGYFPVLHGGSKAVSGVTVSNTSGAEIRVFETETADKLDIKAGTGYADVYHYTAVNGDTDLAFTKNATSGNLQIVLDATNEQVTVPGANTADVEIGDGANVFVTVNGSSTGDVTVKKTESGFEIEIVNGEGKTSTVKAGTTTCSVPEKTITKLSVTSATGAAKLLSGVVELNNSESIDIPTTSTYTVTNVTTGANKVITLTATVSDTTVTGTDILVPSGATFTVTPDSGTPVSYTANGTLTSKYVADSSGTVKLGTQVADSATNPGVQLVLIKGDVTLDPGETVYTDSNKVILNSNASGTITPAIATSGNTGDTEIPLSNGQKVTIGAKLLNGAVQAPKGEYEAAAKDTIVSVDNDSDATYAAGVVKLTAGAIKLNADDTPIGIAGASKEYYIDVPEGKPTATVTRTDTGTCTVTVPAKSGDVSGEVDITVEGNIYKYVNDSASPVTVSIKKDGTNKIVLNDTAAPGGLPGGFYEACCIRTSGTTTTYTFEDDLDTALAKANAQSGDKIALNTELSTNPTTNGYVLTTNGIDIYTAQGNLAKNMKHTDVTAYPEADNVDGVDNLCTVDSRERSQQYVGDQSIADIVTGCMVVKVSNEPGEIGYVEIQAGEAKIKWSETDTTYYVTLADAIYDASHNIADGTTENQYNTHDGKNGSHTEGEGKDAHTVIDYNNQTIAMNIDPYEDRIGLVLESGDTLIICGEESAKSGDSYEGVVFNAENEAFEPADVTFSMYTGKNDVYVVNGTVKVTNNTDSSKGEANGFADAYVGTYNADHEKTYYAKTTSDSDVLYVTGGTTDTYTAKDAAFVTATGDAQKFDIGVGAGYVTYTVVNAGYELKITKVGKLDVNGEKVEIEEANITGDYTFYSEIIEAVEASGSNPAVEEISSEITVKDNGDSAPSGGKITVTNAKDNKQVIVTAAKAGEIVAIDPMGDSDQTEYTVAEDDTVLTVKAYTGTDETVSEYVTVLTTGGVKLDEGEAIFEAVADVKIVNTVADKPITVKTASVNGATGVIVTAPEGGNFNIFDKDGGKTGLNGITVTAESKFFVDETGHITLLNGTLQVAGNAGSFINLGTNDEKIVGVDGSLTVKAVRTNGGEFSTFENGVTTGYVTVPAGEQVTFIKADGKDTQTYLNPTKKPDGTGDDATDSVIAILPTAEAQRVVVLGDIELDKGENIYVTDAAYVEATDSAVNTPVATDITLVTNSGKKKIQVSYGNSDALDLHDPDPYNTVSIPEGGEATFTIGENARKVAVEEDGNDLVNSMLEAAVIPTDGEKEIVVSFPALDYLYRAVYVDGNSGITYTNKDTAKATLLGITKNGTVYAKKGNANTEEGDILLDPKESVNVKLDIGFAKVENTATQAPKKATVGKEMTKDSRTVNPVTVPTGGSVKIEGVAFNTDGMSENTVFDIVKDDGDIFTTIPAGETLSIDGKDYKAITKATIKIIPAEKHDDMTKNEVVLLSGTMEITKELAVTNNLPVENKGAQVIYLTNDELDTAAIPADNTVVINGIVIKPEANTTVTITSEMISIPVPASESITVDGIVYTNTTDAEATLTINAETGLPKDNTVFTDFAVNVPNGLKGAATVTLPSGKTLERAAQTFTVPDGESVTVGDRTYTAVDGEIKLDANGTKVDPIVTVKAKVIVTENKQFSKNPGDETEKAVNTYVSSTSGTDAAAVFAGKRDAVTVSAGTLELTQSNVWHTVTFSGITAPRQVVKWGTDYETVLTGITTTKSDMFFVGWFRDSDSTRIINEKTDKILADATIYAKWVQKAGTVTGNVQTDAEPPVAIESASVKLMKGNTQWGETKQTDESGVFTFENVPAGTYQIVATKTEGGKEYTTTALVMINTAGKVTVDGAETATMSLNISGNKKANSSVEITGNTPDIAVGGLDAVAKKVAKDIEDGQTVTVNMSVESQVKIATNEEQNEIQKKAGGRTVEYISIDIYKTIRTTADGALVGQENVPIKETDDLITVVIPFRTSDKTNFAIFRQHDGNVDILTKTPNADGEYIVVGNNEITMFVKKFSTYSIGYNTNGNSDSGYTGGGGGGGAVSESSYAVELPTSTENGKLTVSQENASAGQTVIITVTPDKGYTLETLTVLDQSGKEIAVKNLGNNKYSFKMPSSEVKISATFMEDNAMLNFFVDVKAEDYFYDAVLWAAEKEITKGTDDVHFSPMDPVTRGQVVTFLWRAAGCPEAEHTAAAFKDVSPDAYYVNAVEWALSKGITKGTDDTHFDPDAVCTRGQIVAFLARFAGVADTNTESVFSDVNASDYFAAAVKWAKDNKVTEGTSATTFGPNEDCTRGQVVTFLYRWMVK